MKKALFLPAGFFLLSLVYCGGPTEVVPGGDGGPGSSSGAGSGGGGSGATTSGGSNGGTSSSGISGSSGSSSGGSTSGGSSSGTSSGPAGSSGGSLPDSGCVATSQTGARVPTVHRVTAAACGHSACGPYGGDAGTACSADTDCNADASSYWTARCLHGACTWDRCMSDGDCKTSELCACASSYYGGNACHVNVCVPAQCRVDTDCASGEYCVPSVGYCGTPQNFHCTKATDPCIDPTTDCKCPSASGGSFPAACVYSPAADQFVCAPAAICAG